MLGDTYTSSIATVLLFMQSVMDVLPVGPTGLTPEQTARVLDALEAGQVVMHATETCYGLTVDIFQHEALERLYDLKEMDAEKPLSIMVPSLVQGKQYGEFNEVAMKLAARFWPGPLTIIVPRKETLPEFLNPEHDTIGLRCPDHALTQSLLKAMGTPLATTSANVSGEPQVYAVEDLHMKPDLILDSGRIVENLPSTIVEVTSEKISLVRRGDHADEVQAFLEAELY